MTKQGLYHQIISFIEIAVYLLLFFGILALHEAVFAAKDGIQFHFYGFAIVNALIFGKVILVAEDFSFAEWFREQRPIYAILAQIGRVYTSIDGILYSRRSSGWEIQGADD